ncbi:uncharacterized protein MELLADRAFT_62552 [Melampsora larici-populina 98AG31]|uniref:Uncharacterized protein n=1 Tax=Melampsora larici-populina (strain 98AG31 / pathotype 3-4-7) TaxID=747676 RepID=F4RJC0_MELLP|nr:uncharacterized protein MELLADRAFT_62552 [Melampsora larici-populina 98AG31]EGG07523.1 hypothetical protein MELLADRAFT_62552 [Melampsora larici-populina 98AG31]
MSNTSNAPNKRSHPFNVSGVFEISEILAPANNQTFTYQNSTGSITCNGWNDENEREYDGVMTGYSAAKDEVQDERCYTLKGRMIPSIDSADFQIYFDATHKVDLGESNAFAGTLHDNTAASGFGIVVAKTEMPDLNSDSPVLAFVMKHTDYRPEDKSTHEFKVEYRMRPTPNLKKTQGLVQEGKETLVHRYIVDWNEEHMRWVVDVRHNSSPAKATPVTPKKRAAPVKKVKGRSGGASVPDDLVDKEAAGLTVGEDVAVPNKKRAASAGKGKGRAAIPVEPEEEFNDDLFETDLGEDFDPPEQGPSTGRGTKAGRQPRHPRGQIISISHLISHDSRKHKNLAGGAQLHLNPMTSIYPAAPNGPASKDTSELAEQSLIERFPGKMPLDIVFCVPIDSKHFRKHIRAYNNALSFTSNGVETDKTVAGNGGTWTCRIFGQLSHNIGSLLPPDGQPRKFAQIFMNGDQQDSEAAARSKAAGGGLRSEILKKFQRFLYAKNPFAKLYKSAEEIVNSNVVKTIKIKSMAIGNRDKNRYNYPTCNQVAAIIPGDGEVGSTDRDVILHRKSGALRRISELNTTYFALRYPVFFMHGSHGWDEHYRNTASRRKCKRLMLPCYN